MDCPPMFWMTFSIKKAQTVTIFEIIILWEETYEKLIYSELSKYFDNLLVTNQCGFW